ncbi:PaaX family transcriptional regulator [Amycolatopsis sp. H20-H5]|uniref:PaaX family transcriptional regulator n=1 Tax=Amycolatopsis sp. H20-H5 TaxID=3046309 RepID=UPI002DBD49E9|nr:PaaX family transcriptional regulator C-terminal domain-containing protein [Amycolatopsis sp. H20-H5]MEC3975254.1 PaaX family transcriptional regulator C-terminal domain-containing protein [Amycolatopsis sp. H20-H5]
MTAAPDTTELDGSARAAQPRQLIVTVYGLYSREEGGWLSVASLIDLLGEVDVDEPAVRSSISRLKRRGILNAVRRGGAAGYELSEAALAILREGDQRIFRRERATVAEGWLLAVFSVPEAERHKRHVLRSQLARLGFGTASAGVWIAPAHLHDATAEVLRRHGLDGYAELFRAEHLAFGDLAVKVREWWDLDQLEELYTDFIEEHGAALERWDGSEAGAFAGYVRALTDWRRLPYLDPGLPAELLPTDWAGSRAAGLFFSLHARLERLARGYVLGRIG